MLTVAPELAQPDPEALLQYFYFGYIADPDTAFAAIKKLPPGHLLEYSGGDVKIRSNESSASPRSTSRQSPCTIWARTLMRPT